MPKQIQEINDLTPDGKNANKGSARGRKLIEQSLVECGAGRSIVVDCNGVTIGGKHVLEAAKRLGIPIKPVSSNGDELVVVVREDLDMETDRRARELALFDNRTSEESLTWDAQVIQELQQEYEIDLSQFWNDAELDELLRPTPNEDLDFVDNNEVSEEKQPRCCPNCGHTW